jgi:hypothetical protein
MMLLMLVLRIVEVRRRDRWLACGYFTNLVSDIKRSSKQASSIKYLEPRSHRIIYANYDKLQIMKPKLVNRG